MRSVTAFAVVLAPVLLAVPSAAALAPDPRHMPAVAVRTAPASTDRASPPPAPPVASSPASSPSEDQPLPVPVMDALRARLTAGSIFFGERTLVHNESDGTAHYESPQFSKASPYLAFEAQPRLWPMTDPPRPDLYSRVYLEGIAHVRLTTIGVTARSETTEDPGVAVPGASILESQKSAQLQFGALLTFNGRGFDVGGNQFHWSLGPVYRSLFHTVTIAQRNRRVWNPEDDLYNGTTLGVRLTLYSRPGTEPSPGRAVQGWTPTAYIDFGGGRFQNFELVQGKTNAAQECLRKPGVCLANGPPPIDEFSVEKALRAYIEGRIFVESVYLGFDLNTGEGPDDLRFMAGFTVDLSRFLTKANQPANRRTSASWPVVQLVTKDRHGSEERER